VPPAFAGIPALTALTALMRSSCYEDGLEITGILPGWKGLAPPAASQQNAAL